MSTTEGPLGFPLNERQCIAVDHIMKALPKDSEFAYRKLTIEKATTETLPGERSDVSWISTEDTDRSGEIVIARGMNDAQFKLNPIVTLNHCYWIPPIGRSLWRKFAKDGELRGIKAKTQYPSRPESWTEDCWPADEAFALVQAGLLNGKSIGCLPTKVHTPSENELKKLNSNVSLIIDEWLLLEYACVYLPCQQNAIVESVSKNLQIPDSIQKALGISIATPPILQPQTVPFTALSEIEKAIQRQLQTLNPISNIETAANEAIERLKGRI